jgi:hypothetical protein
MTFISKTQPLLNAGGNLNVTQGVYMVEGAYSYSGFTNYFAEIRVLSMTVKIVPATALFSGDISMTTLYLVPYHRGVPSDTAPEALAMMPAARMFQFAPTRSYVHTWKPRSDDAVEHTFYQTGGSTASHRLPAELGGILVYSDGPVASAGTVVCELMTTWKVLLRGYYQAS